MKIKLGDNDILESGSIVAIKNEPIDFFISNEVVVRMIFTDDETQVNPPYARKAEKYLEKGAQLNFINYNYTTGIGNTVPLRVGKAQNRELYLNYRIYSLEDAGKLLHYTWFLGKEVKIG